MNRKMMRLALAGKWGGFGASGFSGRRASGVGPPAAFVSRASRSARANRPNPPAEARSRSRRVSTGGKRLQLMSRAPGEAPPSFDVDKFIRRQQDAAQTLPGAKPVLGGGGLLLGQRPAVAGEEVQ